jgi:hypothetical protein
VLDLPIPTAVRGLGVEEAIALLAPQSRLFSRTRGDVSHRDADDYKQDTSPNAP